MNCEVFFEINGPEDEQNQVATKIVNFFSVLEAKGDITKFDGNFDEKKPVQFMTGGSK